MQYVMPEDVEEISKDTLEPKNPYPSGYGAKIPTRYKIRMTDKKWRRVYIMQFSNAGTAYVIVGGKRKCVEYLDFERVK